MQGGKAHCKIGARRPPTEPGRNEARIPLTVRDLVIVRLTPVISLRYPKNS